MKTLARILGVLERWLSRARAPWVIVLVAMVLTSPALRVGYEMDDYVLLAEQHHAAIGLGSGPADLFEFADGSARLRDHGLVPWWSDPDTRLHFFRPLASMTHALDQRLAPDAPALAHAHNLLWYALLIAALWSIVRRGGGPRWVAALALLLYAIDDSHGAAVRWISNRNGLMAATFGFAALWAHDRRHRDGWRPGALLGPMAFALAMGCAEGGIATLGYLVAYAVCLDRARWPARLRHLAPYLAIVAAFAAVYRLGRFGAHDATVYVDPVSEPLAFAAAVVGRLPLYLHSMIGGPPSEAWAAYPYLHPALPWVMWAAAMCTIAGFLWLTRPVLRRDPDARFWLLGAVLAAVPVCAGFPADRQLVFASAGVLVVVARFLASFARERDAMFPRVRGRRLATVAAVLLVISALPVSGLLLVARAAISDQRAFDRADASLPSDPTVIGRTLVIVDIPFDWLTFYTPYMRAARDQPAPALIRVLTSGGKALTIERLDASTLRLSAEAGLTTTARHPGRELRAGDRIDVPGMHVAVERVDREGLPLVATLRFDVALEDPRLIWRQWAGGFAPFTPPPVGATLRLPAIDLRRAFEPPPAVAAPPAVRR